MKRIALGVGLAALMAMGHPATAQEGLKRTVLQRAELTDLPGREGLIVIVELAPGAQVGRHTHPGSELDYVLSGTAEYLADGAAPQTMRPGDSWIVPAGTVHSVRTIGSEPARLLATYVVKKGEPLATPAP